MVFGVCFGRCLGGSSAVWFGGFTMFFSRSVVAGGLLIYLWWLFEGTSWSKLHANQKDKHKLLFLYYRAKQKQQINQRITETSLYICHTSSICIRLAITQKRLPSKPDC